MLKLNLIKKFWHKLPFSCLLCRHPLEPYEKKPYQKHTLLRAPWCAVCKAQFPHFFHCPTCGLKSERPNAPINTAALHFIQDNNLPCGQCISAPPAWDRLICVSDYLYPYNKLLHQFKYQGHFWLAPHLISLLPANSQIAPFVIPVPMHWQRRVKRGFNHSQLLANALVKRFDLTLLNNLKRTKATAPQQKLNRKERLINLEQAFAVKGQVPPYVCLVDDVVTTGATATQLTRLLKKHGAKQVDIICICRTSAEKSNPNI